MQTLACVGKAASAVGYCQGIVTQCRAFFIVYPVSSNNCDGELAAVHNSTWQRHTTAQQGTDDPAHGRPAEVTSSWLWDQNSERLIMCLLKITNISVTNNNNCLAIFSSTTAKLCRHHDRLILHLPLTMVTVHLHVLAVLHIYRLFWAVQTNALSWAILQEFYWAELLRCSYANVRVLISLWNKQWRSL